LKASSLSFNQKLEARYAYAHKIMCAGIKEKFAK
jgi:hypothetical protein